MSNRYCLSVHGVGECGADEIPRGTNHNGLLVQQARLVGFSGEPVHDRRAEDIPAEIIVRLSRADREAGIEEWWAGELVGAGV